jgi:hypothetical protein
MIVGLVKSTVTPLTANKTVNPGVAFALGFTAMLEMTTAGIAVA